MKTSIFIFSIVTILLVKTSVFGQADYELLFLNGSYDEILALSEDKKNPEDIYWNAVINDKTGNSLRSIEVIKSGLHSYKSNERLENLLIEIQYKLGHYSQVFPLLEEHLAYPGNFMRYIGILEYQEKYEIAIDSLEERIKNDSVNLEYLVHLGNNYYQTDRELSAIRIFSKILEINPNDLLSASKLANLYIKTLLFDSAISVCNKSLEIDTSNRKIYKIKGIAYNKKNDHKGAEECFQYLLNQGDSSQFILKNLGLSEYFNYSYEESIEHLELAYANDPNDFDISFVLGRNYLNIDDPAPGIGYFMKADSILQADTIILSTVQNDLHEIYKFLGNYEMAVKCLEQAYEYNSKSEYLFYIAALHQRMENKQEAYNAYVAYIKAIPEKFDKDEDEDEEKLIRSVSLKAVAERNIERLKEDLFFEGEL